MSTSLHDQGSNGRTDTEASRIRFRQPVNRSGSIDAAWWPRSTDLAAEVPALLRVFWTAGRAMTRVSYNLGAWDRTPTKMQIDGTRVHLGGFRYGDPSLLTVSDARHGDTADLLVIACTTSPEEAERLFTMAAQSDNLSSPAEMLERART